MLSTTLHLCAYVGSIIIFYRLYPLLLKKIPSQKSSQFNASTSLIVPARNEAKNLPAFLNSLKAIPQLKETIVVDDRSVDDTKVVALSFNAQVVTVQTEPPAQWSGKNWACDNGVRAATGDFLLFTDADTIHNANGLELMHGLMERENADIGTAIPFHLCPTAWERAFLFFHVLVLVAAAPFQPNQRRVPYAIGQYLLFKRSAYETLGGHASVKGEFAEDIAFAGLAKKQHLRLATARCANIFSVRMYGNFSEFCKGWRRILRWGIQKPSFLAFFEIGCVLASMSTLIHVFSTPILTIPAVLSMTLLFVFHKKLGQFSLCSFVFAPLAALVFSVLSIVAATDVVLKKNHIWRGRTYPDKKPT